LEVVCRKEKKMVAGDLKRYKVAIGERKKEGINLLVV